MSASTYVDLDPYFRHITRNESIAQCAVRACEEILFDRADETSPGDLEDARSCETEIETDERVARASVTIEGGALSIAIETTDGTELQLSGTLTDEMIDNIVSET